MASYGTVILIQPETVRSATGYSLATYPVRYGTVIKRMKPSAAAKTDGQLWPRGEDG